MTPDNEYFAKFKGDIEKAWIKKLLGAFLDAKREVENKTNRTLTIPNFAFAFVKDKMGSWDAMSKTIMLSHYLLRNYSWEDIVQVLRHEMAHMIVSEIWSDIDNTGHVHGEMFAKACNILGVPAETHLIPGYNLDQKEKIVGKIKKLFALGESSHQAESASAVKKAYDLMARYNVSGKELPADERKFIFRPVGEIYGRIPTHVKILNRLISEHYFVRYIYMSYKADNSGYRREIKRYTEFFGEPHNVDVAEYVFHFLLCEGERQWEDFQKTSQYKENKGCYSKLAFLEGFMNGFAHSLDQEQSAVMQEIDPQNTLPIGLNDPLLAEKFNKFYNPRSFGSSGGSSKSGRHAGQERGSKVRIRQGINRGGGSETKLIA